MSAVAPINPFTTAKRELNPVAESTQQRAVADIQSAMVMAKRFPRDQLAAMDRILQACTRPSLADGALYSYARSGSDITGPSIRLAEMLAQNWGNVEFGIRELSQTNGESSVEAFAFDLETNTRQVKVFQVPHVRHTRAGSKRLEDPRDVYELVANQGARRLRACILGIIPGDVVDAAVKQCEVTLHTNADVTPERVKSMLQAFKDNYGVTQDMIQKRIQRRIDAMTPALMVQLKKIYQSLKDGMSSPGDWFDIQEGTNKKSVSLDELQKNPAEQVDAGTGEITQPDPADDRRYDDMRLALSECQTISDISRLVASLTKAQKSDATAMKLIRQRQESIQSTQPHEAA